MGVKVVSYLDTFLFVAKFKFFVNFLSVLKVVWNVKVSRGYIVIEQTISVK